MIVDADAAARQLGAYLREAGWRVRDCMLSRLEGGAGPETWRVCLLRSDGGPTRVVLRTDAATRLLGSASRVEEHAALRMAWTAGVPVPEPILLEPSALPLGAPFFLMEEVGGAASPAAFLGDPSRGGTGMAAHCAAALANIHAAPCTRSTDAVADALHWTGERLADLDRARPALAFAHAWCAHRRPREGETVFAHRDFRIGNLMVSDGRLVAVLDWEYARPSDPHEDLGWFCAPAWRHGRLALEAGGLASRETFLAAYETASGRAVDRARVTWWSAMGQLRWALIAIAQGARALGGQPDLDLALTGHRLPQIERDLLDLTAPRGVRADPDGSTLALFTQDGPSADELETIAAQVPPHGSDDARLRASLHRIAARLRAELPRHTGRANVLAERVHRDGPDALADHAFWQTLRDEAAARCAISDREARDTDGLVPA